MSATRDDALDCAGRGWPVLPCRPPGNTPLCQHGFHDATCDPDQIRAWWQRWPTANIGVRTGVTFDVLDIDHTDFVTGVADLPDCVTDGGPVARSGGGKWHLYFAPTGLGRHIRFAKHCDWLGTDGYVVVPPSTHRSGGVYEWFASPDLPFTAPPAELVDAVNPPPPKRVPTPPPTPIVSGNGWSASGLIARVATAPIGRRHKALYWAARAVGGDVIRGEVGEADALDALDQLTVAAERAGLEGHDVNTTIRDGYRKGGD